MGGREGEVAIEVQSFCYDHAGTAGERVSLMPRRSAVWNWRTGRDQPNRPLRSDGV